MTFPFVHLDALFFSEVLELELLTFSEKKKIKKQEHNKYLKHILETENIFVALLTPVGDFWWIVLSSG